MFKIKPILISVLVQISSFFIMFVLISLIGVSVGSVQSSGYLLAMEIASYISVVIGSFLAARLAWEKGAVYGLIIAVVWVLVRVVFDFAFVTEIHFSIIKVLIILTLGFLSGAFGVSIKRDKFIA